MAALALVSALLAWGIGKGLSRRIEVDDIKRSSRRQEPLPGFPDPHLVAVYNNEIMRRGLVGDLDGTAIAYMAEADGLVDKDGGFRTNLTLERMARILKVSGATIAKPDSPREIDPDAVLFAPKPAR